MNDDALVADLKQALEIDYHAVKTFAEWDTEAIAQYRKCGRRAARELGLKVITRQSDPNKRDDRLVNVWVAATDPPAADLERLKERGDLLLNNFL